MQQLCSSSTLLSAVQLAPVLYQALQQCRYCHKRLSSSLAGNVAQWQAKATKELKGKDPFETIAHHTQDVSLLTL
jgi:hypothetical protein